MPLSSSTLVFAIVVPDSDAPLVIVDLDGTGGNPERTTMCELLLFTALDSIGNGTGPKNEMYQGVIDESDGIRVSCFVAASRYKFLLLHSAAVPEDSIRTFFTDSYSIFATLKVRTTGVQGRRFPQEVLSLLDKAIRATAGSRLRLQG